jgi:hypothetical protein
MKYKMTNTMKRFIGQVCSKTADGGEIKQAVCDFQLYGKAYTDENSKADNMWSCPQNRNSLHH